RPTANPSKPSRTSSPWRFTSSERARSTGVIVPRGLGNRRLWRTKEHGIVDRSGAVCPGLLSSCDGNARTVSSRILPMTRGTEACSPVVGAAVAIEGPLAVGTPPPEGDPAIVLGHSGTNPRGHEWPLVGVLDAHTARYTDQVCRPAAPIQRLSSQAG